MPVTDPQNFFIDGYAFGWRSTLHTVDGIPRRGFRAVSWEETIEREKTHKRSARANRSSSRTASTT